MSHSDYPDGLYAIVRLIEWARQECPASGQDKVRMVQETVQNCVKLCKKKGLNVSELRVLELKVRGVWMSEEPDGWNEVAPRDWDAAFIHGS